MPEIGCFWEKIRILPHSENETYGDGSIRCILRSWPMLRGQGPHCPHRRRGGDRLPDILRSSAEHLRKATVEQVRKSRQMAREKNRNHFDDLPE